VLLIGVAFVIFGLAFAWSPVRLARSVRWVRDQPIPPSPSAGQIRYYRLSGIAFALVGAVVVVLSVT